MPRPRPLVPPYRHHKARNLAFTIVNGRQIYLGPFGSPESREKHARIVREAAVAGPAVPATVPAIDPATVTVASVPAAFWAHARTVYPFDPSFEGRRPPGEAGNYHDAIRPVLKLFAHERAADFAPRSLELVQAEMVADDLCRNVINRRTSRIKHVFKWAVSQGLVPVEVHQRLLTVPGLRKRHQGVRNTPKVRPVPADVLAATLRFCSPRIAAMAQVQLLTGMRSSNLCEMRTADIDTAGDENGHGNWTYTPRRHKTEHHDHELTIRLGPRVQAVLAPYLKPDRPEAFIFSPAEEAAERKAARSAARVTPLNQGNRPGSRPAKRSPRRRPSDRYTPNTYAQAIDRASDKANVWAKGGVIVGIDERLVPRWNPHRLRHNKGTAVRRAHGLDGVQAALGQKTANMAALYAEIEAEKAERIAQELG